MSEPSPAEQVLSAQAPNTGSVSLFDDAFDPGRAIIASAGSDLAAKQHTTSLVIVDPHAAVREGIPPLLRQHEIEVVATTSTGDGAEAVIGRHQPDVALISLELGTLASPHRSGGDGRSRELGTLASPHRSGGDGRSRELGTLASPHRSGGDGRSRELADADGIALLRRLIARGARTAIVLYADVDDPNQSALALRGGAAGLVGKRRPIAELARALRTVAAGGMWFQDAGEPLEGPAPVRAATMLASFYERRTARLSTAERRVLELVAEGRSTESMAAALSLSPHTIRTHLRNVMRKLEASSRAHAVAIAIREEAIQV
jgi:DNA-binding NarL/FixJ family response regulator